jgi:hypothetical protein
MQAILKTTKLKSSESKLFDKKRKRRDKKRQTEGKRIAHRHYTCRIGKIAYKQVKN